MCVITGARCHVFLVEWRGETREVKTETPQTEADARKLYDKLVRNTSIKAIRMSYRIPHGQKHVVAEVGTRFYPFPD